MKAYLALISAAVIGLAACSQEAAKPSEAPAASAASEAAPAETTAPADAAPASEAAPADAAAAPAAAGNCATTVEANDAMQFNTKEIQVSKACKEFTITLKHTGTQPKTSMGHNIVIGKAEDMDGIFKDGAGAADTDYVKPDDARVVAHTKLVGGGEEASLTLDPAKLAGGEYKFACTFPGHGALMNGKVTLVD
ncbi:TPA: azurin [Neisseria subflava]